MDDLIRGKVARILNSQELVLNVGAENGVSKGMEFHILGRGDGHGFYVIKDPDTHATIGSVPTLKITVTARHVQDKLCVASTKRAITSLFDSLMPPQWIKKYGPRISSLKREPHSPSPIDSSDSIVQVGDLVVQVPKSESDE